MYQYDPVNPLSAFAQSFQLVRGIQDDNRARQEAEVQRQQQVTRQRDLQGAIANLRANPSPEAIAEFGLQFPEMKEQMDGYFKTLSDGARKTETDAARDALIAERSGGDVAAVYEQYARAAENSSDPAAAKKFRDAAEFARANPGQAAEVTRIRLAFTDPDAYKLVFDNGMYDTATIKELVAEGLQPGTPEFQAALKAKREGDPWVGVSGVGLFLKDDINRAIAAGQSEVQPVIPEEAVRNLITNPKTAPQFDEIFGKGAAARVLGGGGGSNVTGGFR